MIFGDECRDRFVNRASLLRALDVRDQLARFLGGCFSNGGSHWFGAKWREIVGSRTYDPDKRSKAIRRCVTTGYFTNAARLWVGCMYYSLRGNYAVYVSPSSVLHRYSESLEMSSSRDDLWNGENTSQVNEEILLK